MSDLIPDTDREALLAKWDDPQRPDGWNAGDEHHLATLVIDALRTSQPVSKEWLAEVENTKSGAEVVSPVTREAESLAQAFHETYERLAPKFGYSTREASAVPWADVPEPNKSLMVAVAGEILASLSVSPPAEVEWEEWAQYFERFDSTVGAPKLTGELVAKLLRGPKPFGCASGVLLSPESEGKK